MADDAAAVVVAPAETVLNVNLGVLGHVDSGKTSLVRALSVELSTAALDKHPDSKARGITLDLGFSAFTVPAPKHVADSGFAKLQFTLVDCPGHASLIRTIMGGAQIIDMMLLVIDVTKGVQTQTAECIVIGEILADKFVIVLNKVDLLPEATRDAEVAKVTAMLRKQLAPTKLANAPMVPVAARPGGAEASTDPLSVDTLVEHLTSTLEMPQRSYDGPFQFSIDHCFPIKGQGTVLTGTVLCGTVHVNDQIQIPKLGVEKKVKSMQMFRRPVQSATCGDRVGICVTQLDSALLERGLACGVGSVPTYQAAILRVQRVKFFKGELNGKLKFHVTIGHGTVMGSVSFFTPADDEPIKEAAPEAAPEPETESGEAGPDRGSFDFDREYEYVPKLLKKLTKPVYALFDFDGPITAPVGSRLIASRLDFDVHTKDCRIAFHGKVLCPMEPAVQPAGANAAGDGFPQRSSLRVFKRKEKTGVVDRVMDECTIIGRDLFKKESDIELYNGLRVTRGVGGVEGVIDGLFGKSGKFKVHVAQGGLEVTKKAKKGKGAEAAPAPAEDTKPQDRQLILSYKQMLYGNGTKKAFVQ